MTTLRGAKRSLDGPSSDSMSATESPQVRQYCIRCAMLHGYGAKECALCRARVFDAERLEVYELSRGHWYRALSQLTRWLYMPAREWLQPLLEFAGFLAWIGTAMVLSTIAVILVILLLLKLGVFK